MSLLYPVFLWAAAGIAAMVVGLHMLSRRLRRPTPFPTARFAPPAHAQATEIRLQLGDWRLMFLRLAIVLLLGLAFAQPRWAPEGVARLALIDGSSGVARDEAWRDALRRTTREADAVLLYGGAPQVADGDSIPDEAPLPEAVGLLSPVLIEALRHRQHLLDRAETVELTIISPFRLAAFDAATLEIRALWPGPIEVLRVLPADPDAQSALKVDVYWAGEKKGLEAPLWLPRPEPDAQSGVYAPIATLIAPFERNWRLAQPLPDDLQVVAWWLDGEPAAVERLRDGRRETWLGFAMPEDGDAVLRPSFRRFLDWLEDPWRRPFGMAQISDEDLRAFAAAPAQQIPAPIAMRVTPLALWLLALAILLLLLEPLLRRRLADRPAEAPEAKP